MRKSTMSRKSTSPVSLSRMVSARKVPSNVTRKVARKAVRKVSTRNVAVKIVSVGRVSRFNLSRSNQAPPAPSSLYTQEIAKDMEMEDITSKLGKLELTGEIDCILEIITLALEHLYLSDEMDWQEL